MCNALYRACCLLPAAAIALGAASRAGAQGPIDRTVKAPTRVDWTFAAQGFGTAAAKLPAGYDSTKQRYQLFVPKQYQRDRAWPLVLFISAGKQPAGWGGWRKACEQDSAFFCAPYGVGNEVTAGQRIRIVLDALDDVRRAYRIDPDQTYVSGFSGGGRMACTIGFALPEYFGGIVPLCGTNPIAGSDYLRHRIADRLSVAFVTGVQDFNRKENEVYMAPWLKELGIRTRLWVVPKLGHAVAPPDVLRDAYAWLQEDLPRRRSDAKAHPHLAIGPEDAPAGDEIAKRLLASARAEFKQPDRTWRGIALLQGAAKRGGNTGAGQQARQQLKEALENETLLARVAEQGAKDEQLALSAQARALERFGRTKQAIEAWSLLVKNYSGTPIARDAEAQIRRLNAEKKE